MPSTKQTCLQILKSLPAQFAANVTVFMLFLQRRKKTLTIANVSGVLV